jgi:hypothetical protein
MLVPGAMAATWEAMVINIPALAARAPPGATYVTTGTLLERNRLTISRVDCTSPPGVSSISTSMAFSASARSMAATMKRAVTGFTLSSSSRNTRTPSARNSMGLVVVVS